MQRLTKDNFATAFQVIVIIGLFSYTSSTNTKTVVNATDNPAVFTQPAELNTGNKKYSEGAVKLPYIQPGNLNQAGILTQYNGIPNLMLAK